MLASSASVFRPLRSAASSFAARSCSSSTLSAAIWRSRSCSSARCRSPASASSAWPKRRSPRPSKQVSALSITAAFAAPTSSRAASSSRACSAAASLTDASSPEVSSKCFSSRAMACRCSRRPAACFRSCSASAVVAATCVPISSTRLPRSSSSAFVVPKVFCRAATCCSFSTRALFRAPFSVSSSHARRMASLCKAESSSIFFCNSSTFLSLALVALFSPALGPRFSLELPKGVREVERTDFLRALSGAGGSMSS
mmetsp:Transcript_94172/g.243243  ORF Transcript_94172/g.243243 Transcript_94172/m.243243 type:complete len:256 (+) Transcript_94172:860-1627(+)